MFSYHRILMKNNRLKFIGFLGIQFITQLLYALAVKTLFLQDPKTPVWFLYCMMQGLNIFGYVFLRLLYKVELFLMKDKYFHSIISNEEAFYKIMWNKGSQFIIIFFYQFCIGVILSLIMGIPLKLVTLLFIYTFISVFCIFMIYINDVALINQYPKHYWNGIPQQVFFCGLIALFFLPSLKIVYVILVAFLTSTVLNIMVIMKGNNIND